MNPTRLFLFAAALLLLLFCGGGGDRRRLGRPGLETCHCISHGAGGKRYQVGRSLARARGAVQLLVSSQGPWQRTQLRATVAMDQLPSARKIRDAEDREVKCAAAGLPD